MHSLEITLCACVLGVSYFIAEENNVIAQLLKITELKKKKVAAAFKERGHVRRTEGSPITVQMGFRFAFCASWRLLTAWRVAWLLAAPNT